MASASLSSDFFLLSRARSSFRLASAKEDEASMLLEGVVGEVEEAERRSKKGVLVPFVSGKCTLNCIYVLNRYINGDNYEDK